MGVSPRPHLGGPHRQLRHCTSPPRAPRGWPFAPADASSPLDEREPLTPPRL